MKRSAGGHVRQCHISESERLFAKYPTGSWRTFDVTTRVEVLEASGLTRGKCADLNALYVGLARAAGLPARDASGIRIAKSEMGYKSPGVGSQNITKAQHCGGRSVYRWLRLGPGSILPTRARAETRKGRIDRLDPDSFKYEITSREIPSAIE